MFYSSIVIESKLNFYNTNYLLATMMFPQYFIRTTLRQIRIVIVNFQLVLYFFKWNMKMYSIHYWRCA